MMIRRIIIRNRHQQKRLLTRPAKLFAQDRERGHYEQVDVQSQGRSVHFEFRGKSAVLSLRPTINTGCFF
ncbi:MAG: hypothetical protein WAN75_03410, partial [Xanthobacteraceae bacterium]